MVIEWIMQLVFNILIQNLKLHIIQNLMSKLKSEVIKYSKKLNITNLSALRSGNISVRAKEKEWKVFI